MFLFMSVKKNWLQKHLSCPYVKQSQRDGLRSRAAYKLLQIDEKFHLLRPGHRIVDLGSAPGGWSIVAKRRVGPRGQVIGIDRLEMAPVPGVDFIQGDLNDDAVWQSLASLIDTGTAGVKLDGVISDMAPDLTGQRSVDQPRMMHLLELSVECAENWLSTGGYLVMKAFQGQGIDQLAQSLRRTFKSVRIHKPSASRDQSREIYLVASGYKA